MIAMVDYVRKDTSLLMRVLGVVLGALGVKRFNTDFWTTLRLPFGRATIYYPTTVTDPLSAQYAAVRQHELVHVAQQLGAWGLFCSVMLYLFFPLPVLLSGRWFVERHAWLISIEQGGWDVDMVVEVLWESYLWPWPRAWMRRWFLEQLYRRSL